MTEPLLLPNLLGFMGIALNFLWPFFHKREAMLWIQALACAFFVGHFYLIGAVTGSMMVLLAAVQALVAIPLGKVPSFRFIYVATIPAIFILAFMTWAGTPSILSSLALGFVSYGRFQQNTSRFRLFLIISLFCWITHNLLVWSIPGLTSDFLSFSSSVWMYLKNKSAHTAE